MKQPEELCKKFNGKLLANYCVIGDNREVTISLWTHFTKDKSKEQMNEDDIKAILNLAKTQPRDNWHFFAKEKINNTLFYKAQAYTGSLLKKGEYYGWQFLVNKEGFIAKQQ